LQKEYSSFLPSLSCPVNALRPQFDGPRLAPTAIFPLELLPLGDIDACTGKNHTEVKPRDGLDSVKPQANRVVNQLFGCFRRRGIGATTPSIRQRQQDGIESAGG
jgi:hypothetical protein